MDSASSPDGRVVARRYRLQQRIGQGGMGTVWRAYDEVLDRTVAIKEIALPHLSQIDQDELRERAMREARAAARLSHPNAITVHDIVVENGNPWIVMALVDSGSLADVLRESGPLPPQRVAMIGLAVLSALEEAHAAGILHRDVKPGNVLLGSKGRVVLTDFGIATLAGDPSMTMAGLLLGAPAYMAPERAAGQPLGPASDLWSLGATLYTAVEGRPPFDRDSAMATLTALMNEDPRAPRSAGQLTSALMGLLVRDPARRMDAATARRMLEIAHRDPTQRLTHLAPAVGGQPTGVSRIGERTQIVARPASMAVPPMLERRQSHPQPQPRPVPQRLAGPIESPTSLQPVPPRRPSRWWAARIALAAMMIMAGLVGGIASPGAAELNAREKLLAPGVYEAISFPAWIVPRPPTRSLEMALAYNARAVALVLIVGLLLYRVCRVFRVRRGRIVVLAISWCVVIAAAAIAGAAGAPFINGIEGSGLMQPKHPAVDFALSHAADGALYGGVVGWLPALFAAAVAGRRRR